MKHLIVLMLIFSSFTGASQAIDSGKISLIISEDTLTTRSDEPYINLNFSVRNCSGSNVILYELDSKVIMDAFGMMDPFCDQETTSAAIRLYVFDATSKPVTAMHWYVNDLRKPMTKERFDSIMSAHKESYLERTVVINKFENKDFEQEVDMQEFHLEKGQYFIQLLYFAGKRIRNFINEDEISQNSRRFDAAVFQGCLVSNKSVLLVK